MNFYINGTGEICPLFLQGKEGEDQLRPLLEQTGTLEQLEYDEDFGAFRMDAALFEWWQEYTTQLQNAWYELWDLQEQYPHLAEAMQQLVNEELSYTIGCEEHPAAYQQALERIQQLLP